MNNLILSISYGILRIQYIKKCGNYKIINAITTEFEKNIYLAGIVDTNHEEILPFQPDIEINYIGGNNFFVKMDSIYYHYKINREIITLKNQFDSYKKINSNHFLITKDGKKAIYNLNEKALFFSSLSAFHESKKYNKQIASFVDTIQVNDIENIELAGMIDLENNFTNNSIYNITEDEIINISTKEEYKEYCTSLYEEIEQKETLGTIVKKYINKRQKK